MKFSCVKHVNCSKKNNALCLFSGYCFVFRFDVRYCAIIGLLLFDFVVLQRWPNMFCTLDACSARAFTISDEPIYFKLLHVEWVPSKINFCVCSRLCCCFFLFVHLPRHVWNCMANWLPYFVVVILISLHLVKWTMRDRCCSCTLSPCVCVYVEQWFLEVRCGPVDQMQKLSSLNSKLGDLWSTCMWFKVVNLLFETQVEQDLLFNFLISLIPALTR